MPTALATAARVVASPLAQARDLLLLAKPRLSALVVFTCAGGMWLAPREIGLARAAIALLSSAAVVGAANALNCYLERDVDARMRRTRDRPLPAGRLDPMLALGLGVAVPAFALPLLALAGGRLSAFLALVALVSYVLVYTPLKRRSPMALVAGAVPGAIPPAMGWAAVTGRLDAGALALFAVLFAWQLPHFLSVSLYLRDDYARGGLPVFALVHGERATRAAILATTLLLAAASVLPAAAGLAGPGYAVAAGALDAALLAHAALGLRGGARWARSFFLGTLVYLTLLFAALALLR
ncbi:MAG TPA: heme o synthase [Anaeromyxobacter sp.]|nr:heme o synthase [Anaeromyxobacter sp.]